MQRRAATQRARAHLRYEGHVGPGGTASLRAGEARASAGHWDKDALAIPDRRRAGSSSSVLPRDDAEFRHRVRGLSPRSARAAIPTVDRHRGAPSMRARTCAGVRGKKGGRCRVLDELRSASPLAISRSARWTADGVAIELGFRRRPALPTRFKRYGHGRTRARRIFAANGGGQPFNARRRPRGGVSPPSADPSLAASH